MPSFDYQARDATGAPVRGTEQAGNREAVAQLLVERRLVPVRIDQQSEVEDVWQMLRERLRGGAATDDLLLFTRQMHAITRSGVPLVRGLRALADSTASAPIGRALGDIIRGLESGRGLADCMEEHPKIFTPLYRAVVLVGEQSGRLDEAFSRLYGYLGFEKDTTLKIKKALRYPAFVLTAIIIAMGVMTVMVIPAFAGVFARFDTELPLATRLVIGASDFVVNRWPVMLVMIGAAVVMLRFYLRSPSGRLAWDRRKLRLPVVGSILHRAAVARFCRAFHATYVSGVPIATGLRLIERVLDNAWMAQAIHDIRSGVERGDSLHRAATASGMFTPLALQMIALGEETGELDQMMVEVADFYEGEVEYAVDNIGASIEPILTILIGMLVLVLALAVFLPMWDLFRAAAGR